MENQLKLFRKWVKLCKKLNLLSAKMGDWEYSALELPKKTRNSKKSDTIEGLVHDPSAAMPSDSEMLYYSTETFDSIRNSRKDPVPRI